MKNLDLISGIILLVGGAALFLKSLSYPIGTFRTPGGGLFPLIASILLIGLSATLTLQALMPKKGKAIEPAPFFPEKGSSLRVLLVFVGLLGYRYLLPVVGFAPSTGIFVYFLIKLLGGYGWKASIFSALVTAVITYYVFQVWLKVPMPLPILRF